VDRVFLDANILFAAALAPKAKMLRLWEIPSVVLLTSAYAVEEARRSLHEAKQRARLDRLLRSVQIVASPHQPAREERRAAKRRRRRSWRSRQADALRLPPDDRPILQAAVAAKASHLLTGNHRDFGAYYGQHVAGVLILPPAEYPPLVS
jgi:predicted nucleic acid-binding protein